MISGANENWQAIPFSEDQKYYYFSQTVNASDRYCQICYEEARSNALLEMVRILFGTNQKIEVSSYANLQKIQKNVHMIEKMPFFRAQSFREIQRVFDEDKRKLSFLFSFPKSEYLSVKRNMGNEQKDVEFDELVESAGRGGSGVLMLVTRPSGAAVYIDGIRWGETPLVLKNKLTIGPHDLILDHPTKETLREELVITGGLQDISRILNPAKVTVNIDSNLEGAEVYIGGVFAGKTPLNKELLIREGSQNIDIRLTHPEGFPYSQSLRLKKDEKISKKFDLDIKPASVVLTCRPYPCTVVLDGEKSISLDRPETVELSKGDHHVDARKDGYGELSYNFSAKGGERLSVPIFEFVTKELPRNIASDVGLLEITQKNEDNQNEEHSLDVSSRYHHHLFMSIMGNSTPEISGTASLIGFGYRYGLQSNWIGLSLGGIFFPKNKQDGQEQYEESGYSYLAELNLNVTSTMSILINTGEIAKTSKKSDSSQSYLSKRKYTGIGIRRYFFASESSQNGSAFFELQALQLAPLVADGKAQVSFSFNFGVGF